jgi:hypothetical protein
VKFYFAQQRGATFDFHHDMCLTKTLCFRIRPTAINLGPDQAPFDFRMWGVQLHRSKSLVSPHYPAPSPSPSRHITTPAIPQRPFKIRSLPYSSFRKVTIPNRHPSIPMRRPLSLEYSRHRLRHHTPSWTLGNSGKLKTLIITALISGSCNEWRINFFKHPPRPRKKKP